MKTRPWLSVLALTALLAPGSVARQAASAPDDPLVVALIAAHNAERAREKLPPLRYAPLLEVAARGHAKDMANRGVMAHEGGDGSTPSQRIVRAGYFYQTSGENVAQGYKDVPEVMTGWMDSPPHKKNILGDFTEIGVARVEGENGRPYWCANFAKPIPRFEPEVATTELRSKLNAERSEAKLAPLAVDERLAKVAREQANGLAKANGKAGTRASFDGIDSGPFRELAMTTAEGQPDPDGVLKMFLDSPDHKGKLLGNYSRIGIGYATGEEGRPFWCVIFGLPAGR